MPIEEVLDSKFVVEKRVELFYGVVCTNRPMLPLVKGISRNIVRLLESGLGRNVLKSHRGGLCSLGLVDWYFVFVLGV